MLIVIVYLQNVRQQSYQKNVLIVLGKNAVVGKVFILNKNEKIVYLIKLKKIDFVIIPLVALIDSM